MAITDNDGRTPLHYAATIKDNGHFYNVLSQLGANPKALDKVYIYMYLMYMERFCIIKALHTTNLLNV